MILGQSVVCDRYIYDTVTDMAVDLNHSKERIRAALECFLHFFLKPCLVFLIDVPEETAYKRKVDIPSMDFLKERRTIYLDIAREYEMTILDGSQDEAKLKSMIQTRLDEVRR